MPSSKSSKTGTPKSSQMSDAMLQRVLAQFASKPDPIDTAIEKIMNWPMKCDGVAFPLVARTWMSHPAFELAL